MARALDHAMAVARAGERAEPPLPAPSELQPFLGFRKLTGPARTAVANCLDDDADFRERVREAVPDATLDTAAHLYLDRPSGWRDELVAMAEAREERRRLDEEQREDRSLRRRLEQAESRLEELDRLARESVADAKRLRDELNELRRTRRALVEDLDAAVARCDAAESAAAESRRRADEAEAALAVRARELGDARARLDRLQGELDERPPAPADAVPTVDADDLGQVLQRLRSWASGLDDAVRAVEDLMPPTAPRVPVISATSATPTASPRRRPTPLPGGLRDDSVAAASHLLGVPGMHLLVDGYNVTMAAWGSAEIADQRERLVGRLEALAARTGVTPIIVFDGTHGHPAPAGRPRHQVRVRFSAGGVEADDEILALVDDLPVNEPITVVSNDRRVLDGARERGANVVTSTVLLDVL